MKRSNSVATILAVVLTTIPTVVTAQREAHADSAAVASVVTKYNEAIALGDSGTALALLADDAVILESGGIETRAQYRTEHLPADIKFAKSIRSQRSPIVVRVHGDAAWATSTSTTQGQSTGRTVNSVGAELMVLVRTPQGWKIAAIHWSTRQRRAG